MQLQKYVLILVVSFIVGTHVLIGFPCKSQLILCICDAVIFPCLVASTSILRQSSSIAFCLPLLHRSD
ncbi:hypothetical protein JHK87_008600 [Glycine soja]|nr:hypothetical protein JHK87_008600 [Glycine soja]